MEKARSLNPFSMESIDLEELYQQPQQGRIMVNDDVVLVIGGHIQHTRFLEEDCHLEKGSVMLLPSDTILEAKAISTDARVVAVVFREGMDIPEETILSASPEECDRILRMVYLTWDIMQLKPYRRKTIQHLLQSVVSNVLYIKDIEEKNVIHSHTARAHELFIQFKRLVHRNCTRERSIPFYAEQMHVTPHHLSATIKKASGQSVMYWINRATVQEAKILLKTNGAMGYEIAYRLNFPSASAFSKFFKRETGLTPRMYQERAGR